MEEPNVNNLNGIPNFGHGLPEDGVVIAGVTDVPQESTIEIAPEVEVVPSQEIETPEVQEVEVTNQEQIEE